MILNPCLLNNSARGQNFIPLSQFLAGKTSAYTPELLDALIDSIMGRISAKSPTTTDVDLLELLRRECLKLTEDNEELENFPWPCWKPSLASLSAINQVGVI